MAHKIIKTTKVSEPIPINDLTEVKLDGSGVFDNFLSLHRIVLDREFKAARIVGKEYSDVFTKTYTANLEMAISFLLAKEKQAYEIELQEAQIKKAEADTAIANKQLEIMTAMMPHEVRLMEATADKMVSDALIAEKNLEVIIAKLPLELALMRAQMTKMTADTDIALKQLELLTARLPLEIRLTEAQIDKMEADVILSGKQIELATAELSIKAKELIIKDRELDLMEKELLLRAQKIITEKAQTDKSVIGTGSVIDANIKTLEAQILGMDRDAQQKLLQLMLSTWTTRANNDAAYTNKANMLTDDIIGRTLVKAFDSTGISSAGYNPLDTTKDGTPA